MNKDIDIKLSIIIPVYNSEKYVQQCLESVIKYMKDFCEVIVIDDGSSDNSFSVISKICSDIPGCIFLTQENQGVSKTRNRGIKIASGKYIMFLDADDCIDKECWKKIYEQVNNEDSEYDLCIFDRRYIIDSRDNIITVSSFIKEVNEPYNYARELLITTDKLNPCWGNIYLRSIIIKHNIRFDEKLTFGEDLCFVLDYFKYVRKVNFIEQSCVIYRIVNTGAMHKFNYNSRIKDIKNSLEKRRKLLEVDESDELINKMNMYYFRHITACITEICKLCHIDEAKEYIRKLLHEEIVNEIIDNLGYRQMNKLKLFELIIIKSKMILIIVKYFNIKNKISKKIGYLWGKVE